jgi:hypothetical protein
MNVLDFFNNKEVRKKIREEIIEYEYINGQKVVSEEYIKKIDKVDPIDVIEKLMGKTEEKGSIFSSLVVSHIKRVIMEEIADLNYDVSRRSTVEEYERCILMNGFKKIFQKDHDVKSEGYFESVEQMNTYCKKENYEIVSYEETSSGKVSTNYIRKEKECIYWNEEYSFLWHFDTYGNSINSAEMSANLLPNDENDNLDLGYSGGIIQGTKNMSCYFHMSEHPARKIKEILKNNTPIKEWEKYDQLLHSTYTQYHADYDDIDFEENTVNKLKEFPKEVLDKLLSKNIRKSKAYLLLEEKGINIDYHYDKEQEFFNSLSIKDLKEINARKNLLDDIEITGNTSLSKKMINKALKFGCNKENLLNVTSLIKTERASTEDFMIALKDFTNVELVSLIESEDRFFVSKEKKIAKKEAKTIIKIRTFEENSRIVTKRKI